MVYGMSNFREEETTNMGFSVKENRLLKNGAWKTFYFSSFFNMELQALGERHLRTQTNCIKKTESHQRLVLEVQKTEHGMSKCSV